MYRPRTAFEDSIAALIGEQYAAVVTAVPDESRGERIVAFYTDPEVRPQDIWDGLCGEDLPRLWVPRREDLRYVETIPTLGTSKVDLRASGSWPRAPGRVLTSESRAGGW